MTYVKVGALKAIDTIVNLTLIQFYPHVNYGRNEIIELIRS
jgi:hypothetical protein